jgi:16S rRNA (cytosine967-C5)-methyltransferase
MVDPPRLPVVNTPSLPLSQLLGHTADTLSAVREGRSLTDVLTRVPAPARPGTQALIFHVLRWLGGADLARRQMVPKPPAAAVDALLTTALALLWPTGGEPLYASHTLVDQAVTAATQRARSSAPFVNAVLRRFLRERDAIVAQAERDPVGAFNYPLWWIERVRTDWPDDWQRVLHTGSTHAPFALRVNARHATADEYRHRLESLGIGSQVVGPQAVVLDKASPVLALPGFKEGEVSVQDASAQLAAPLVIGAGLRPGARVLDACAAPGGKTAHLLELADLDVLALDSDASRLSRVTDNLSRLHLQAGIAAADARAPAQWWDGVPFDAILLDAPCTASGIVRRHPDIRWLRRPGDVAGLTRIQHDMLDALWPLLAPGGRFVYCTCSVFKAEGVDQIDAFLGRTSDATLDRDASPGHLLPVADNAGGDGFFYAVLLKAAH